MDNATATAIAFNLAKLFISNMVWLFPLYLIRRLIIDD